MITMMVVIASISVLPVNGAESILNTHDSKTTRVFKKSYNFFSNSATANENDYYDGEFSKAMYDKVARFDPKHMRKYVHIGTSNGIGLLYLAIGLQLNGHGSLISSFDYQRNENPFISRTLSLLPNIEIYRHEASSTLLNIVANKILHADVLLVPCNPLLTQRIFGVELKFLYQFVNKNKYIAVHSSCFSGTDDTDENSYNKDILEALGFELVYNDKEEIEAGMLSLTRQLQLYQRKDVYGANIMMHNAGIGKFVKPVNGAIIQSNQEVETQTFTIDMNQDIFVGLSDDLFVNFTVDGFSVIDKFDVEEQARLQKHWTVKGFTYGTHIGEFKLIYGNEMVNVPIGKAITILFDRMPVTPLPGLQSEFKSYRFGNNILQATTTHWSKFMSKKPIRILLVGCSMKSAEINMYTQQCKRLSKNIFKFTYVSTCQYNENNMPCEKMKLLNDTCNGNFFLYDDLYNQLPEDRHLANINYEQLSKIHTLSQLKETQYRLLDKVLSIFENQDIFLIQSINDHKYYHLPYIARLSKIQYRAGLLHDEIISPPKRPFGFQAFITDSAMQCRNADYRRRTRLPCYIINPGISLNDTANENYNNKYDNEEDSNKRVTHDFTIAFISQDKVASSPGIFLHICSNLSKKYNLKCLFFTEDTILSPTTYNGKRYDNRDNIDRVEIYKEFAMKHLKIKADNLEFVSKNVLLKKLEAEVDVALYLNMQSSFGVEILQSIALNVTTMSFGVGGSVTFLQPNVTTSTLTSTNVNQISDQIAQLINDKNGVAQHIKKNAFKLIENTFDISNVIADYEDFYLNQFLQHSGEDRIFEFCMHSMTSIPSEFCVQETGRLKKSFMERKLHLRNGQEHIELVKDDFLDDKS